jgi:Domain of unknown function (DUF1911)
MYRDTRADAAYFTREFANLTYGINKGLGIVSERASGVEDPDEFVYRAHVIFRSRLALVGCEYSTGVAVEAIKLTVMQMLDDLVLYKSCESELLPPEQARIRKNFATTRDTYVDALRALCLAVIFDADSEVVRAVASRAENEGSDFVFDSIASRYDASREIGGTVVSARPYARLQKVFEAAPDKRPALMAAFLDTWYRGNKGTYWWDGHAIIDRGGLAYSGYWCFEAAAVVKLLDIDDSSFRDNEYYPADLLHP